VKYLGTPAEIQTEKKQTDAEVPTKDRLPIHLSENVWSAVRLQEKS
jgi:hypothetical protein